MPGLSEDCNLYHECWKRMRVLAEGRVGIWGGCGTYHGQAEGSWLCRDVKAELLRVL